MSPTPAPNAAAAPLPPLPDMSGQGASAPAKSGGFLKSILAGTQPVQDAVTSINAACKQIVMSGAVPGSEQLCAQIIALANQLVPMAVQQAMGGGAQGGQMTPPPGPQGPPPQGQGQ